MSTREIEACFLQILNDSTRTQKEQAKVTTVGMILKTEQLTESACRHIFHTHNVVGQFSPPAST
jgi:hypothetical protein